MRDEKDNDLGEHICSAEGQQVSPSAESVPASELPIEAERVARKLISEQRDLDPDVRAYLNRHWMDFLL